ncbi:hypothetical protein ABL78_1659 [Leptomonas seymouri]|uniref:C3H1-type domain-containing protein n=1 Tax=Leptomonas seymouri TaxID=5684 RepID=A0A0N0P7W2_LEPSE|nr:hypothetical protein ABL78_1659 [Leptomonas seymouri]|eukprot:KPI89236.1 hypothetical protein ABL78_1659 [Leptomonas seymouri]
MFAAPNDIAMGGNQQMVYKNNQAQGQQRTPQQPPPQQVLSQYSGYQQQQQPQQMLSQYSGYQQQQSYLSYPNTDPSAGKGASVNSMAFQPYMPQQQMFPYGYPSQQAAHNQYAQPASQQQPQHPRNLGYSQQGSNNSTNQYMGGGGGAQMSYRGGRGRGGIQGGGYGQFHRQVHNNQYYNQQRHYSSNNAVPEKTPTVHLINPETKKIISIKLNRIYSTMADIRPQLQLQKNHHYPGSNIDSNEVSVDDNERNERSKEKIDAAPAPKFDPKSTKLVLCMSFLSPHGCIHGSGCDKMHIAGLEYTWQQVTANIVEKDGKKAYTAGFHVHCYDPTLTRYYKVPSESVYVTKGSSDYVTMYNDHGDNFKMKFTLCQSVIDHTECSKGESCDDIHCAVNDLETVRENSANATHINNADAMADVPRLPSDMTVRVFNHNSFDTWHDYPGINVLITEGAKAYQKQYEQGMNNIPTRKRMQHCAHFRLKDMCRLGESCRFLHVLPTEQEIKERKEAEAAKLKEGAEKEEAASWQ